MTNDERIEAAARALGEARQRLLGPSAIAALPSERAMAAAVLSAAYPEIHPPAGQEPTHWLAPNVLMDEDEDAMADAYHEVRKNPSHGAPIWWLSTMWKAVREAHVKDVRKAHSDISK